MIIHIRLPQCLCRYKKVILFIISAFVVYRLLAVALWPESRYPAGSDDAIDIVYTWVNGSDPLFLTDLDAYLTLTRSARSEAPISSRRGGPVEGDASRARFADKYELKFSLRSLERHAPWFRHVFIVTNGQIPYWLDLDYERVTLVSHEEIFEFVGDLPTFSSPAIEAQLHRIPGISKRFVYFNDDIFLGAPTYRDDFVSDTRGLLVYLAWPVPPCSQDCPWLYVSDGQCDEQCHNAHCQYDGGDCNQADVDVRAQLQAYSDYDVVLPRRDDEYYEDVKPAASVRYLYETDDTDAALQALTRGNASRVLLHRSANITAAVRALNAQTLLSNKLRRRRQRSKSTRVRKSSRRTVRGRRSRATLDRRGDNATAGVLQLEQDNTATDKNLPTGNNSELHYDAFSESLQHANRLFNVQYGYKARYVAAHAPILIDRDIMARLFDTFADPFRVTTSHKLRTGTDMQFAFSYYNFVMEEKLTLSAADVFDVFDTDKSGTWSDREIRTILTKIYELPLDYAMIDHLDTVLANCSDGLDFQQLEEVATPPYERYIDSKLTTITKAMIVNCPVLLQVLTEVVGLKNKYPYTILKNSDTDFVTFKMLSSNVTNVIQHLDLIRRKPTKFVCINDNLDATRDADNEVVVSVLYDFYLSLFPLPSRFELAPELRNRFLHVSELRAWRMRNTCLKVAMLAAIVLVLAAVFNRRIMFRIVYRCC